MSGHPVSGCTCVLCRPSAIAGTSGGGGGNTFASGGVAASGGGSIQWGGGAGGGSIFTGSIAPRPGYAGITGFDGQGEADYPLAPGCVRGVRGFTLPDADGLSRILAGLPSGREGLGERIAEWMPRLTGVTGYRWLPGVNIATCNNGYEHRTPDSMCGCGYWGYWTLNTRAWPTGPLPVAGVIEGAGRVLIGEKGFRCEKARIIALCPAFTVSACEEGVQELADAIMGYVLDALGARYPGARAFATAGGMLASVSLGEITEVLEAGGGGTGT